MPTKQQQQDLRVINNCLLTYRQKIIKRVFDLVVSILLLLVFFWLIVFLSIISFFDTKASGIFSQSRIGQYGKPFTMFKIRTMRKTKNISTITTSNDERITYLGRFFRRYKLDEIPQLINVVLGDMSLVGPRPDVSGYADKLVGKDRIILTVKPGITGIATIYFRNEEKILSAQEFPHKYNKNVIWPKKIELNKKYVEEYSFLNDIRCIVKTLNDLFKI